jgi:hypothetical protein
VHSLFCYRGVVLGLYVHIQAHWLRYSWLKWVDVLSGPRAICRPDQLVLAPNAAVIASASAFLPL